LALSVNEEIRSRVTYWVLRPKHCVAQANWQQLCGLVMTFPSKGELRLSPRELLRRTELKARFFAAWALFIGFCWIDYTA